MEAFNAAAMGRSAVVAVAQPYFQYHLIIDFLFFLALFGCLIRASTKQRFPGPVAKLLSVVAGAYLDRAYGPNAKAALQLKLRRGFLQADAVRHQASGLETPSAGLHHPDLARSDRRASG